MVALAPRQKPEGSLIILECLNTLLRPKRPKPIQIAGVQNVSAYHYRNRRARHRNKRWPFAYFLLDGDNMILHMLVGVPGSGKTTFRERNFELDHAVHVCSDSYIERIATMFGTTYNAIFRDAIKLAQNHCTREALRAIEKRLPVVWDQTNITVKSRKEKLELFPATYKKVAWVIPFPGWEELDRRLADPYRVREKTVPRSVIENMVKSYVRPTLFEGFDEIKDWSGELGEGS